jgi:hypothetical protein
VQNESVITSGLIERSTVLESISMRPWRTPGLVCMSDIRHSCFGLMMTVKGPFVDNLAVVLGFQLLVTCGSAGPIFR